MAKLILALLAAGMPALLSGGAPDQLRAVREKLETGQPLTLASIGDSITWICNHTDGRRNYLTFVAEALEKRYPKAKIRLEQSGNRGSTPRAMPFLEELLEVKPDMVFVMFGMNDSHRGLGELDSYDVNLTKLIRRIREAGAVPVILTQNEIVYPADGREALPQYVAREREVAIRENALLVDNFSDWQQLQKEDPGGWKLYLNDVMHPNLAGHRRIAKAVLRQLWPEATAFQYSGLWPLAGKLPGPVDCLVPGPLDKQLLRIGPSIWVTLTGRRRGDQVTDLVLSVAAKEKPGWDDFRHFDVVGPEPAAVFPWGERPINSAMLLRNERKLFVFFSHTVRRNLLVVDTSRPGWTDHLGERASYETLDKVNMPLPESMGGNYQDDTEYVDGYIDREYPVLFSRDILLDIGRGIIHESLPRGEVSIVLPNATRASVAHNGPVWFALGQTADRARLVAASSAPDTFFPPAPEPRDYSLTMLGTRPLFVARTGNGEWRALAWTGDRWERIELPSSATHAGELAPISIHGTSALLSRAGQRISVLQSQGGRFVSGSEQQAPGGPWRYEGATPPSADSAGLLFDDGGIVFSQVALTSK